MSHPTLARALPGAKSPRTSGSIVYQVEHERREAGISFGNKGQGEHHSEYFLIRCYKNGNLHIWLRRDDLVDRVNQLLGEYYGAPIPEERQPDETDLFKPKTALAKNYGFYPTPSDTAETVVGQVPLYRGKDGPPLKILEPSAGTGNLARLLAQPQVEKDWHNGGSERPYRHIVDCVEVHPERAKLLKREGLYRQVINADFLALQPDPNNLYDRIAMNPPFDRERDIDHVMHALKFLKPDGFLVSIMSAGTEFRETKKATQFRALMEQKHAQWQDLPAGSFSSVGTNINTLILRLWNNGRRSF
jgi:type I restriction-modification system DNA methylase subunit